MGVTLLLAWRNIWRHKRRTVLNLLAIAFGTGLLVFNLALQLGSYDAMVENSTQMFFGQFQIQDKSYQSKPRMENTIADIEARAEKLRKQLALDRITVRANGFALLSTENRSFGVFLVGMQPESEAKVTTLPGLVRQGSFFSQADQEGIVIGESLAKNLKVKQGDELTLLGSGLDGSLAATVLKIRGIFRSGSNDLDRQFAVISFTTFQDVFSMQGHGHAIVVGIHDVDRMKSIETYLKKVLKEEKNLRVLNWEKLLPGMKELIELDFASGWFFYGSLIVIIAFSILNTFLMSALERTKEFGVMLALGFQPHNISLLIIVEAIFLGLIGACLGILLGSLINMYFLTYGFSIPGMEEFARQFNMPDRIYPKISLVTVFTGPIIVFGSTLLAALYPSFRIRKLRPVEAMRTV